MSKPFLGLRTTIYKVGDLDRAKRWYAEAFGAAPYFDEPSYVGFDVGGYELGLLPDAAVPPAGKTDNVLSYWGVEAIEPAVARLVALGASEHRKPANVGGEIVVASVRDPWGNVIGLIHNPDFKPR